MQPTTFKKGTNVHCHTGPRILGLKNAIRKTLQVLKNPVRLLPSGMTSTVSNSLSRYRKLSGKKRQYSLSLSRKKTDGALKKRTPPWRSTRLISATACPESGKYSNTC